MHHAHIQRDLAARRVGFEAAKALDKAMRRGTAIKPMLLPPTRRGHASVERFVCPGRPRTRRPPCGSSASTPISGSPSEHPRFGADLPAEPGVALRQDPRAHAQGGNPAEHIERAKMLLSETSLKMPQVAKSAGFSPHQVFSRIFGKAVGMRPSDYRKKFHH